ncbi:unnamed protein product [Rhizophagus irregularis]|nr:unnamed protein product [Rhizophagus irregularis]
MREISTLFYQNEGIEKQINNSKNINNNQLNTNSSVSSSSINSFAENHKSKIYNFEILSEPRNATEEELEAYRSVQFDLSIPEIIASKQTSEQKNSLKLIEDKPKSKKLYNNKGK